jgi:ribonuclease BN (tRNA processing enzyme)
VSLRDPTIVPSEIRGVEVPAPRLCVLSSSSSGNCAVVVAQGARGPRGILIDAGLSPRRTAALLAGLGLDLSMIDAIVLTHLDQDHWNPGWSAALSGSGGGPGLCARLWLHRNHRQRAQRECPPGTRFELFDDHEPFEPVPGALVRSRLLAHDAHGVACLRLAWGEHHLGYATDLGGPSASLISHLAGVGTLAIESNYCPVMQMASDRPAFLKRRIMDGSGHLSNEQSAHIVRALGHRGDLVLLHLSRECNTPERASQAHGGAASGRRLTVAMPDAPTPWIEVARARSGADAPLGGVVARPGRQLGLFV